VLCDVGKSYPLPGRRITALAGIDLALQSGELVAVVGASGSGKSTLLRIIAGLEAADTGSVRIGGANVPGPGPACGLVFQEPRLFPWLSVWHNVAFGVAQLPRSERQRVAYEQLARVGLRGFETAFPHQLSGGMAQRAALARALAPRPRLLLLDEPFGALDALTKVRLQEELLRLWQSERMTLLLVTHDVEEAVFLADRVVVMSERPGSVRCVLPVPLERPRDRTSAEFAALRRRLLAELPEIQSETPVPA
jgi:sulfonate transport system ATP-binding protein